MKFFTLLFALTISTQGWSTQRLIYPQLKVLTFNVWAVPVPGVSKKTEERFQKIPAAVAAQNPDIVVFEEAWLVKRKAQLVQGLKKYGYRYYQAGFPNFKWTETIGFRGVFGNGLLVVSKFPLSKAKTMKFSQYTRAGERPTFKGAMYMTVAIPEIGLIDLFVTQLGSVTIEAIRKNGFKIPDHLVPEQLAIKELQANELTQFIVENNKNADMLLVGDLSTHYYDFKNGEYDTHHINSIYQKITCYHTRSEKTCLHLTDTFSFVHGLYGQEQTTIQPYTYDIAINDYAKATSTPSGTMDYIFVKTLGSLLPVQSEIVFNERNNNETEAPFLSDHYGLMTTFQIQ